MGMLGRIDSVRASPIFFCQPSEGIISTIAAASGKAEFQSATDD
jgi:hypothetical protein